MRPIGFAILALAALAAGCLLFAPDDPGPPVAAAGPSPLAASLVSQPQACSLCHYAWDLPVRFNGSVEETAAGVRYRMTLAPVAAYNLTDVRVVPVFDGTEGTSAQRIPARGSAARGGEVVVPIHLAASASALHVLLSADREFGRSDLVLTVEGEGGPWASVGAGSVRAASIAPEGGLAAGMYAARVRYADGGQPTEAFQLLADIAPPGVRVVSHATAEAPAEFDFTLPARARGFSVQVRPMNEHPTDKWYLPNWGDRGELSLFVAEGALPAPRVWTDAEIAAAWGGESERVFHDSTQDGVIVRTRDPRGEWTRQARWITPPGEEQPFPPLPPGTREVVADITYSPRTPLSPAPAPFFGWATGTGPVFYYPMPETEEPGHRVYRVAVEPAWWQAASETGGFQAFALLPLDERSATVFDGSFGVRLTARR